MKIKLIFAAVLLILSGCISFKKNSALENNNRLNLNWQNLSDTSKYSVIYIQLNFDNYPSGETIGRDILYVQNDNRSKKMILTNEQEFNLFKLVTDSSNFSVGECGTFHLNAGFLVYKKERIVGRINIGCGCNQWNFSPVNSATKWGSLSDKGFKEVEKLLDNINLANK